MLGHKKYFKIEKIEEFLQVQIGKRFPGLLGSSNNENTKKKKDPAETPKAKVYLRSYSPVKGG